MIIYSWSNRNFRNIHKKYTVSTGIGSRAAKADTLAEAKKAGEQVALREGYRGKWNLMYITLDIHVDSGNHFYYKQTGWKMYVPVRGSGKRQEAIEAEIKRAHGVKPFVWTKK